MTHSNAKPQHTSGPWFVDTPENGNKGYHYIRKGPVSHIATVHENSAANARLIAAAPELMEELQRLCNLPADDNGERIIPAAFLDGARAAIAKAEGRE